MLMEKVAVEAVSLEVAASLIEEADETEDSHSSASVTITQIHHPKRGALIVVIGAVSGDSFVIGSNA